MSPELIFWLALLLFLLGFVFFVLEAFVFVGFGMSGLIAIILVCWGILLLAVDVTQLTAALAIGLIATLVFLAVGIRLMGRYKMWYRLTVQYKQQNKDGYVAPPQDLGKYTGMEGIAITPLRPSGTADIAGERLDVVTEGDFIPTGARVVVSKVEGLRVIVRSL
jgi:membrane-bound serine protease (ClpP class)